MRRQLSDKGMVTICAMLFVITLIYSLCYIFYNHGKVVGFNSGYNYVIENQYISYDEVSHEKVSLLDRKTFVYGENGIQVYEWEKEGK